MMHECSPRESKPPLSHCESIRCTIAVLLSALARAAFIHSTLKHYAVLKGLAMGCNVSTTLPLCFERAHLERIKILVIHVLTDNTVIILIFFILLTLTAKQSYVMKSICFSNLLFGCLEGHMESSIDHLSRACRPCRGHRHRCPRRQPSDTVHTVR